jgi:triosephosphate isomerase
VTNRKPFVGGNWKMNTNRAAATALTREVTAGHADIDARVDVAVFVPFVYIDAVRETLHEAGGSVRLGAQDFYDKPDGAFTGEISIAMLQDLGVTDVLVGHSERRHVIGEGDDLLNRKALAALDAGLNVTFCIGETLEQREAGETDAVNERQLSLGLKGVTADRTPQLTIAYEPVWAIGTGRTATPEDAQSAHAFIRKRLGELFSSDAANAIRIQYGGSVKPNNAAELFGQPDIDGGLIGGASLKGGDFLAIVEAGAQQGNS